MNAFYSIVYYSIWVVIVYLLIGMIVLGFHLRWLDKNDPQAIRDMNEDPMGCLMYTTFIVIWWLPNAVSYLRAVLRGEKLEDEE
jgi:hypothetical protein